MSSAELEGDVKKSLLDRPDAEKVFQPWWDSVEDYLLNILIALGQHNNIPWTSEIISYQYVIFYIK